MAKQNTPVYDITADNFIKLANRLLGDEGQQFTASKNLNNRVELVTKELSNQTPSVNYGVKKSNFDEKDELQLITIAISIIGHLQQQKLWGQIKSTVRNYKNNKKQTFDLVLYNLLFYFNHKQIPSICSEIFVKEGEAPLPLGMDDILPITIAILKYIKLDSQLIPKLIQSCQIIYDHIPAGEGQFALYPFISALTYISGEKPAEVSDTNLSLESFPKTIKLLKSLNARTNSNSACDINKYIAIGLCCTIVGALVGIPMLCYLYYQSNKGKTQQKCNAKLPDAFFKDTNNSCTNVPEPSNTTSLTKA